MKYMLDTNICIFVIKHKPPQVVQRFLAHPAEDVCISSITYAELCHGVEKSQAKARNQMALMFLLSNMAILPFDDCAAKEYGRIRADLERKGTPIGPMDMLIAGHAKAQNLVMVTNNVREFQRVEGLVIEDWAAD